MANEIFKKALEQTLSYEGGYSNNPKDKGGETYRGIARNVWPNWTGWKIIDSKKPLKTGQIIDSSELDKQIQDFYFKNYWTPIKGDKLFYLVSYIVFDTAVMQGPKTAIKILQKALNKYTNKGQFDKPLFALVVDGKIGAKTIEAANRCEPQELVNLIAQERLNAVEGIVSSNPTQAGFLTGWTNRIKKFIQIIAKPSNIGLYLVAALVIFFLIGNKKK